MTPAGVVAPPFMALTPPPADVDVPTIPTAEPLVTIVPVGGGVPGMDEDMVDDDIDVMPARGFWSRDTRDCCNPIG